jgi:hypothetical protein
MPEPIRVFILTYCRNPEQLYGTTLIFRTLRVGFPTGRVTVVDNASIGDARPEIERLAREAGCDYRQLETPGVEHAQFLADTVADVSRTGGGTVVFIDPDVCLWQSCEDFAFSGLIAGQLSPAYDDEVMACATLPRLHSSFLWIPDARRLDDELRRIAATHVDFRPFLPVSVRLGGMWVRYDTGASLFAALGDHVSLFTDENQACYDHIFGGTHLDLWRPHLHGEAADILLEAHARARAGDLEALRGLWKKQQDAWERWQSRGKREPSA